MRWISADFTGNALPLDGLVIKQVAGSCGDRRASHFDDRFWKRDPTRSNTCSYDTDPDQVRALAIIAAPTGMGIMCAGALESDFEAGGISILSRVGAGLLALTTGQSIMWPDRAGKQQPLRIIEVMKGVADAIGDTCRFCALLDALLAHFMPKFRMGSTSESLSGRRNAVRFGHNVERNADTLFVQPAGDRPMLVMRGRDQQDAFLRHVMRRPRHFCAERCGLAES